MFDKEYTFSGCHAEMVKKLTAQFGENSSSKIFSRNIDVYINAPIIGFLYGRRAKIDNTGDQTTKIFPEQLIKETTTLRYMYQLILLLSEKNKFSFEERIDKAFRNYGNKDNAYEEILFNEYVLGGVEVLYEKIFEVPTNSSDYIRNLYDFMDEFHERFNKDVSSDEVIDLCRLAQS